YRDFRRATAQEERGARRLTEVARMADPDPWRNRLRSVLQMSSRDHLLKELKELAKSPRLEDLPAASLSLLGATLSAQGDPKTASTVLSRALRRYPGDVWINHDLAMCLERIGRTEEAIRFYTAARSL